MSSRAANDLEFVQVEAVTLAVSNAERAKRFYRETLGRPPDNIRQMEMAFMIGDVILLLRPQEDCMGSQLKS